MPQVQTVTGPVETAELGPTLMHEHVFVLTADVQQNYPEEWGYEDERVADAVARLTALAATGVRTIVDPTVIGLGRYIPRIQRIAEQVDLNIVVATGCYTYDDVPFFFHYRGPALNAAVGAELPDPMVDMFVGDIEQGIAGTGVRAVTCRPGCPGGASRQPPGRRAQGVSGPPGSRLSWCSTAVTTRRGGAGPHRPSTSGGSRRGGRPAR